jgi:diguanylate cyclase (GGDEF)-like protein
MASQARTSAPARNAGTVHGWVKALPHAGAVVMLAHGRPQVVEANSDYLRHAGHDGSQLPHEVIEQACAEVLNGIIAETTLTWDQGGFAGRIFDVTVRPIDGHRQIVLLSLVDRTTSVRSEATLRRELVSDSLTGLPNRAGFGEILERRLAEPLRQGEALTLLIVDLVRFSRINESIGALAGDELILTVARRLRHQSRPGDVIARIGGDEFALLGTTRPSEDGAASLARRVRAVFENPFRIGELMINVDCAVGGIAALTIPSEGEEPDTPEIVRQAQIALKQAKRSAGVVFYEPLSLVRLHQRFDLETALRAAIESETIDLAFQPLVNMKSRRITGFEALARWKHGTALVSPGEFVPIAEDSGLILPLGRLVLRKALHTLAQWDKFAATRVPLTMSVNVSPIQLARDDVVAMVREALVESGIDGHRLTIEVTESSVVNATAAESVLHDLAALGVRIAMDDFGTGYSNIASLQRLPIHTLKIDRSLVAGIDTSADSLAIVRTIQRLGEALGLKTTAEGIETETMAQQVAAIGCDNGQGYLFARPLEADAAFDAWQRTAER